MMSEHWLHGFHTGEGPTVSSQIILERRATSRVLSG